MAVSTDPDPVLPAAVLAAECRRLLEFGTQVVHPLGGAAWLDDRGRPDPSRTAPTFMTARMAHVYAIGVALGFPGAADLVDAMTGALLTRCYDHEYGGWFTSVGPDGGDQSKTCYTHAFVVLAAASATVVGRPDGPHLLEKALAEWTDHFWDDAARMFVDRWDRTFTTLSPYRGTNANMHAVEALLAAADATGDRGWTGRAADIAHRVVEQARRHDWRLPEHYDLDWQPLLDHHRDRPDDQFEPFGATVGHGFEWSRLLLHLGAAPGGAPWPWAVDAAMALFDRAVRDGWSVDGAPGFVYTTDFRGRPVSRHRLHWVAAEAIAAAGALFTATGEPRFRTWAQRWWEYAQTYLLDTENGSWHSELDEHNHPVATVWPGKPDLYHGVQAMVLPRLPLAPTLVAALAASPVRPPG